MTIVLLSLGAVWPLLGPGYFPMHDDTQVARVFAMSKALGEGQFPVRWVSDLGYGYGYPIFNFYGPLPYYFGGALVLMGLSALVATKIMFIAGILLLAITTFVLANSVWGVSAGVLASVLALYAPYHAVQIYVRGAVGEFWASAFVPLIILGLLYITKSATQKKGIIVGAIGLALVIVSHTISGYMAMTTLVAGGVVYGLLCLRNKHVDVSVLRSGFMLVMLGLGLSAFFWLPAVYEMRYTAVSGQIGTSADFHKHFICPLQLWESVWGFGGSVPGCVDGLSLKLGKLHVILSAFGVMFWLKYKSRHIQLFYVALFLFVWSTVFATPVSAWAWDRIAGYAYIQYPWRFLSVATLGLALIAASIGMGKKRIIYWGVIPALIITVIVVNVKWFRPQYLYSKDSDAFESATELRYRASKVSDEYLPPQIIRPDRLETIARDTIAPNQGVSVFLNVDTAIYAKYTLQSEHSHAVLVNRAYFPGWMYYVNTKPVEPLLVHGLPSILVPRGESILELRFTDTPVRTVANLLSTIAVIWLGMYYGKTKKAHT